MSCYVCRKERGTEKCSRDDCENRVCKKCLGVNAKNDGSITGGSKWVTCQNQTQYYCSKHLIRKCVCCDKVSDGCTKCAPKKMRGGFRILGKCNGCQIPFAVCDDCRDIFELPSDYTLVDMRSCEESYLKRVEKCYRCKEYFCNACGSFEYPDPYDIDNVVTMCDSCSFRHVRM